MKDFKSGGNRFKGSPSNNKFSKSFGGRPSFGGKPDFNRGEDRGGFGGRDNRAPQSMHQAVCDSCNKTCEVPFRPTGDKPVYCKDCFHNNGAAPAPRSFDRAPSRPIRSDAPVQTVSFKSAPEVAEMKKMIESLTYKMDRLIFAIEASTKAPAAPSKKVTAEVVPSVEPKTKKTTAKTAAPEKTAPAAKTAKKEAAKKEVAPAKKVASKKK